MPTQSDSEKISSRFKAVDYLLAEGYTPKDLRLGLVAERLDLIQVVMLNGIVYSGTELENSVNEELRHFELPSTDPLPENDRSYFD